MSQYKCPLCHGLLNYGQSANIYEFHCSECGFTRKGLLGYSLEESYSYITKKGKIRKKQKKGFKTKGKQRPDYDRIILEEDPIIMQNVLNVRKNIDNHPEVLKRVLNSPSYLPVFAEKFKESPPKLGIDVEEFINLSGLAKRLKTRGIHKLYDFQERAFKAVLDGLNVIISAPTGLGKTEAFILPIIYSTLITEPNPIRRIRPSTLLMYPTKALAADQLEKIRYYCKGLGIKVAVYDGDTPSHVRKQIMRTPPDILITNPDMIHYHLTGNYEFRSLISNLQFLVIDEVHLCVGTFGSNILWIIRRLRRFSPRIQCIGASATISNAHNFAETLFDQSVEYISAGTARKSDLYLSMLYPRERSNLEAICSITREFIREGHKTLVFGNSHRSAETINLMLRDEHIRSDIHRAGLTVNHRRKVENAFKSDKLEALVSTPTLELGIDIGDLDSVISQLTNLTRFVQRIGRAGRKGQTSFATLVLNGDDPISAYYARNPDDYISDLLPAYVEPDNKLISYSQVLAMILEKPMKSDEIVKYEHIIERLLEDRLVIMKKGELQVRDQHDAIEVLRKFSIRGVGEGVSVIHNREKIGSRALPLALRELHEGAIYLHGGRVYRVRKYDTTLKTATLIQIGSVTQRTQSIRTMKPQVLAITNERDINGMAAAFLELQLTETVLGYEVKNIFSGLTMSKKLLDDPISYTYNTKGFALVVPRPEDYVAHLGEEEVSQVLGGTYHAIEHVLIESGNSLTGGGASQIGGLSMGDSGLMFIYDGNPGGSGLSQLLYDSLTKGLTRSLKIMNDCPCNRLDGCPRCTYSYQCGNNNQPLNRVGGIEALMRFGKDSTSLNLDFEGKESYIAIPDMLNRKQK